MFDIIHDFPINVPASEVFRAISTPNGLDAWWTKSSTGKPERGEIYSLSFGPGHVWSACVSKFIPDKEFELTITTADSDWLNTKVGFTLSERKGGTKIQFYHCGWPESSEHYRISNYCWAMYLRILKRNLEYGEQVKYENRLDA